MTEEKKYVTFRDLRVVAPAQKPTTSPSSTSTSSISDTLGAPELSPVPTIIDKEQQTEPTPHSPEQLATTSIPSISSNARTSRTSSSTSTPKTSHESETRFERDDSAEKPKRP